MPEAVLAFFRGICGHLVTLSPAAEWNMIDFFTSVPRHIKSKYLSVPEVNRKNL